MMLQEERRAEIVNAVYEALRITANWIRDLQHTEPRVLSELVVTALRNMALVVEGDIPSDCRDIHLAVRRFADELHQYIRGHDGCVTQSGAPQPRFWGALEAVERAAHQTEKCHVIQLESVAELRAQKVSDDQIGACIYGNRGVGPFMTSNKTVNKRLIDQAAKSQEDQDAILKDAGWPSQDGVYYPPWLENANTGKRRDVEDRLKVFKLLQEGPRQAFDPATVEEMLLDGCYIQQIEKYKGVTRAQILEAAAAIGVKAIDAPGSPRVITPKPLEMAPQMSTGNGEVSPQPQQSPQQPSQETPTSLMEPRDFFRGADEPHVHDAIKACLDANPQFGPPEVVRELGEDGIVTNAKQVGAVMREMRKRQQLPPEQPGQP